MYIYSLYEFSSWNAANFPLLWCLHKVLWVLPEWMCVSKEQGKSDNLYEM